ncbi:hypothetical protein F511_07523 [Dorcoceras hygrometricum]|uniref:Uncharacterized protein n=1 Tax=Dorcoceras hygrometricum TaxID=472368 RepID=A0A2Z7B551_9LAMI|nr:hypothetical protein F511_07523 [Dorcoceras hygrometricum]
MYSQQPAVSSQHRFCTVSSQLSYDWSTQLWTVNSALTNENSDFGDENSDSAREFHTDISVIWVYGIFRTLSYVV